MTAPHPASPAVSAIVRTRGAGDALRRTLESLLSPRQGDLELIVIDEDHDGTAGRLCRQYASCWPDRIRLAGTDQISAAAARNRGLDLARGEYVAFIEGGDSVSESFCDVLLQAGRAVQADISRGVGGETGADGLLHGDPAAAPRAPGRRRDRMQLLRMNSALYRRAFLTEHALRFPEELCCGDDLVFEYRTRRTARQVACDRTALYRSWHPQPAAGLTRRELEDAVRAAAMITDLARGAPAPAGEAALSRLCHELVQWLYRLSDRAAKPEDADLCRTAACRLVLASPYAPQFRALLAAADRERTHSACRIMPPAPGRQAPAVSVIVPVYNVRDYVGRALESAVRQTLPGIEIIVVDDGSADGSATLCREYAARHPGLITVIAQAHAGVAAARNRGLEAAHGEYVAFLDADDYLAEGFCQALHAAAVRGQADIAKGVTVMPQAGGGREERDAWVNAAIRSRRSRLCFMFYMFCAMYRRDFIERHALRFREELEYCEDVLFLHEAVLRCRRLVMADDAFYYHCRRMFSADAVRLSRRKMQNAIAVFTAIAGSAARCRAPGDLPGAGLIYGSCISNLQLAARKACDPADAALARSRAAELQAACPLESRYLEMWQKPRPAGRAAAPAGAGT